jgi:hypothetical protein
MVSSHVSVDIPFHHHHCNRISSTAIGDWEEATSCIHRGWARAFMFFRSPDCSRFWRARFASEARTKQRAKARESSSSHEARSPSSSIASSLVLSATGGLTTAEVTGPSRWESRAGTCCFLLPAIISNTGELAGFSLSTDFVFLKGVFVCSQSGNHPLRGFSQIWLHCTKRYKSLINFPKFWLHNENQVYESGDFYSCFCLVTFVD